MITLTSARPTHWGTACAVCGLLTTAHSAQAQLLLNVRVNNGPNRDPIGTISANITADGSESATFTLAPAFRFLMNDTSPQQFRWYQVITYDDEPTKYMGKIIVPAGTAANTMDVVDVPSGGWDYESADGNKGGDDASPFYESDTVNNPATGKPYYFPNLAYPRTHDVSTGTSVTRDGPGLNKANHKTLFETLLTYEDPTALNAKVVCVLGGFSWGVQTDGTNDKSGIAINYLSFDDLNNSASINALTDALGRSGFSDWSFRISRSISAVPEPSALPAFAGIAFAAGLLRLRRRRI